MSIGCLAAVFDHYSSTATPGEMLLAIVLADNMHEDDAEFGGRTLPEVGWLAFQTRQSEAEVKAQLKKMIAAGWLRETGYEKDAEGQKVLRYAIDPVWLAQSSSDSAGG